MKTLKLFSLLVVVAAMAAACSSVRVATDYDRETNFGKYRSFAFYKPGIDRAEISDLDKKRILRAIQNELVAKGLTKSDNPDILISIFTKERDRVDVYQNAGWGYGWGPYWGMGFNSVSTSTEGSLYIDLIDAEQKELVWQGKGTGNLVTSGNVDKKDQRIREFVQEILAQFPPGSGTK